MKSAALMVDKNRLWFHPDFVAEIVISWRILRRSQANNLAISELVTDLIDHEGIEMHEAIQLVRKQIMLETVQEISRRFWEEYRRRVINGKGSSGGSCVPSVPASPSAKFF